MILKIIKLFDKLAPSKNNNTRLVFRKNNNNDEINKFGISSNDIKYAKKLRNLKD